MGVLMERWAWLARWSGWAVSGAVVAALGWALAALAASGTERDWGPTDVREGRRPGEAKDEHDPQYDTFYQLNSARVLPNDGGKGGARFAVAEGSTREDEYATLNAVDSDRALPADKTQPTKPDQAKHKPNAHPDKK